MTVGPRTSGWLVALLFALCGCVGGLPATRYYTLRPPHDVGAGGVSGEQEDGLAIGVELFTVQPPYDQDRLVFRKSRDSTEVGFYAYHRWASPLGHLASLAVADGLRGTHGVTSIEQAASSGEYSARLSGRVLYIEEVDLPGAQEARVALELKLRDVDGATVWSEVLSTSTTVDAASGEELMRAVQRSFEILLEQARRSLSAALDG